MAAQPCRIRGVLYPSQRAAAQAIGVHESAICNALANGRENRIGRRGESLQKPCLIDGKRYPSRKAAALALGVTRAAISKRIRRRSAHMGG